MRFYLKQIPCKIAIVLDNLSLDCVRPYPAADTDAIDHKLFISMSKNVPLPTSIDENGEQCVVSLRSYSASMGSLKSSDVLKSNFLPAFTYTLKDQSSSSENELGPISKQDKAGMLAHFCVFRQRNF